MKWKVRAGRATAGAMLAMIAVAAGSDTRPEANASPIIVTGAPAAAGKVRKIVVQAEKVLLNPKNPAVQRIGRLRYMGGLSLTSPDREFGGFSALLWDGACDRLLAASDTGVFLALDPQEDTAGKLLGVRAGWLAPVLGLDGKPAPTKVAADSESLSRDGGYVLLWFEQKPRAQLYLGLTPCKPDTLSRPATRLTHVAGTERWPVNGGPEAVSNLGSLQVIISEQYPGGGQGREGLAAYGSRVLRRFTYRAPNGHDPSALDRLSPESEDRRFVALNRRFSLFGGFSVIVTEFTLPLADGADVKPTTVAWLKYPYTVDNLEGLAVRQEGERRFLYMISDNNFMFFQRTLLLKFELLPGES